MSQVEFHDLNEFAGSDKRDITLSSDEIELIAVKPLPQKRRWYKFFDEYEYEDLYDGGKKEHKWYHWFDPNDTPEERKYIIKLDLIITIYCFVSYWVKNLDQSNVNNAYVTGMQEDLGLKGNALTDLTVMYNVGAVVGQLPFIYFFPKVRMDLVIPGLDIIWGLFTLAQYRAKSQGEMMAYRFLIGLAEAPFFPGVHYVLGAWFKSHEIQRRGGIFYMGNALGSTTAGLLQASIYKHLDGHNGIAGWRWMFIIDAIITIPIGILGFILWPGTPDKLHSIFLTEKDAAIAKNRARRHGLGAPKGFSWKILKQLFSSWHLPVLAFWDILFWNSSALHSGFILWLQALGTYSKEQINNYSAIPPALLVAFLFIVCFGADFFRSRWFFLCLSQLVNAISAVILAIWTVPDSAKWFAFMVQYTAIAMSSVMYGWINSCLRFDDEYRSTVLTIVNTLAQQSTVWTPLIFWQTSDAPRYYMGYVFSSVVSFTLIAWTFVVLYFYKRQEKDYYYKRLHEYEIALQTYNSEDSSEFVQQADDFTEKSLGEKGSV
ncbi:major facilitator superfamily domain-containing protein [Dipodascopsis uninucleata]